VSGRRPQSNEGLGKLAELPDTYVCNLESYVDPREIDSNDVITVMHLQVDDFTNRDYPLVHGSQATSHFTPINRHD
jgi:hypothetical protein